MSNQYPERVLRILRQRIGDYDSEFDHSLDERCNALPPRETMQHLVAWEFGYQGWLEWFESKLNSVGLKIVPMENEQ